MVINGLVINTFEPIDSYGYRTVVAFLFFSFPFFIQPQSKMKALKSTDSHSIYMVHIYYYAMCTQTHETHSLHLLLFACENVGEKSPYQISIPHGLISVGTGEANAGLVVLMLFEIWPKYVCVLCVVHILCCVVQIGCAPHFVYVYNNKHHRYIECMALFIVVTYCFHRFFIPLLLACALLAPCLFSWVVRLCVVHNCTHP